MGGGLLNVPGGVIFSGFSTMYSRYAYIDTNLKLLKCLNISAYTFYNLRGSEKNMNGMVTHPDMVDMVEVDTTSANPIQNGPIFAPFGSNADPGNAECPPHLVNGLIHDSLVLHSGTFCA